MPEHDLARLRGLLAERRIQYKTFARLAGLSREHTSRLLNGHVPCGPSARAKLDAACVRLGLDGMARSA